MKLSQFKMDFFSVWLEDEAARLMLNACFYVCLETVLSAVQHQRLTASNVLFCEQFPGFRRWSSKEMKQAK